MNKRILLLLVAMIGLATSVGWAQESSANIKTDLTVAQKGKTIVFSITTQKGSEENKNVIVESKVTGTTTSDMSKWNMKYYEPNGNNPGWIDCTSPSEGDAYIFGPSNGFPLSDATSYFQMTPAESGTFTYTLSIKEANEEHKVIKTVNFDLKVSDGAVTPIASIVSGDKTTNYASLDVAVKFAEENSTINLSEGNFLLDRMLNIKKSLSIEGSDPRKTIIKPEDPDNWISAGTGTPDKHLINIDGKTAGTVALKNVTITEALASGINAQSALTTKLENVYLRGNANAGLLVHSQVEATGLHTEQNKWGAVNVDKGSPFYDNISFKFDKTSTFKEPVKIWSEITDNESIVKAPEGWTNSLNQNMRIWTNSKLGMEFYEQFPSNSKYTNTYFIYANGNPVTISPSSDKEQYIKVSVDGATDDFLEIPESGNPVIFGGSKYADVESSHITMTGGKVSMIFGGGYLGNVNGNVDITITGGNLAGYFVGGGYGPKAKFDESGRQTADVKGKVTANISNAYIRYLVSGGMEYARTEVTDITVTGDDTDILYALGGGFAPVGIGQSLETSYNDIANRTNTATFSMTKGKISGCFYIGGGYSYSYTKEITASFNGVNVEGGMKGVGSNGRSDKVTATFTECNFSKGANGYTPSIAAVNRGKAEDVSMTFTNCTFTSDIKCYLGADAGWQDGGFPTPVSGNATFAFTGANVPEVCFSEGMQDVSLTGAPAKAMAFTQKESVEIKAFTLPEGKTWTFNNGLEISNDVTLTKTGTLTVKGTYTISKTEELATALPSITPGGTIKLSGITAKAMLTALNNGDKKELKAGICLLCSDEAVYTDEASAQQSSVTGTVQYIKLEGGVYTLKTPEVITSKPSIKTKPTASTIDAGQPLSASILDGGWAVVTIDEKEIGVNGVFSWMEPSKTAEVGTKSYKVVFTPSDLTKYQVIKDIEVEIKDVKQYYTVTIGKCENGKIEVEDGNSAGRYENKKELVVKAIPDDHYNFSAWGTGITGEATNGSYTVAGDDVLTATFVPENYTVTIGKNVKVTKQDGTAVNNEAKLPYGTVLNVVAAPTEEVGSLKALTCNGKEVINSTVTVDGDLNIQATFNAVVPSTYRISLGEGVTNGKIQLFDTKGNEITFGAALPEGSEVSVVDVPDPGYELSKDNGITVSGATYADGKFTVAEAAVTVSATFVAKKFEVKTVAEHATVELSQTENLTNVDYGTSITITKAEADEDYKLLAVVVNGKEIAKDESFIVKGTTKVNAVTQKLPDVVFTDKKQTYTYNKEKQSFVVRTVPAGISGITITYKKEGIEVTDPTDAGTYTVFATLAANSSYASMNNKEIGTLEIEKAPLFPAAKIPTVSDITDSDNVNEYHWISNDDKDQDFRSAYYKLPANSNYREPKFTIPGSSQLENSLPRVKLSGENWIQTRSGGPSVSLTLNAIGGSISVWNGDVQVTSTTPLYAGQKLTLKAIPSSADYSTRPDWSSNVTVDKDGIASIILPNEDATVTADFEVKHDAPFTPKDYTSTYTGTAFGSKPAPTIESPVSGWVISFEQEEVDTKKSVKVSEPTAVGRYTIKASRSADDVYKATEVTVGTLTIEKVKAEISDVVGTDITTIQTLNQSEPSGTTNVEGIFSWKNPDMQLTEGEHEDIEVLFTPTDNNYAPVTATATVMVKALTNKVAVRTIVLTENDAANGNGVVLTLNGTEVTAGTTVKAGDKLTATFNPKSGYTASAKINDESYTSGNEYTIKDEAKNVTITIIYTKEDVDPGTEDPGTDPGTDPGSDPSTVIDVKSVSLDKSELTLAPLKSYTLKVTFNPSNATNKKVTWESSDETVATVDADGTVTAVASGKATITVTTEDGGMTATCVVTVDFATAIEEAIANTRVYSHERTICIEPVIPVNVLIVDMSGKLVYNASVSSITRIPVSAAGIYIVKFGTQSDISIRKISVK